MATLCHSWMIKTIIRTLKPVNFMRVSCYGCSFLYGRSPCVLAGFSPYIKLTGNFIYILIAPKRMNLSLPMENDLFFLQTHLYMDIFCAITDTNTRQVCEIKFKLSTLFQCQETSPKCISDIRFYKSISLNVCMLFVLIMCIYAFSSIRRYSWLNQLPLQKFRFTILVTSIYHSHFVRMKSTTSWWDTCRLDEW